MKVLVSASNETITVNGSTTYTLQHGVYTASELESSIVSLVPSISSVDIDDAASLKATVQFSTASSIEAPAIGFAAETAVATTHVSDAIVGLQSVDFSVHLPTTGDGANEPYTSSPLDRAFSTSAILYFPSSIFNDYTGGNGFFLEGLNAGGIRVLQDVYLEAISVALYAPSSATLAQHGAYTSIVKAGFSKEAYVPLVEADVEGFSTSLVKNLKTLILEAPTRFSEVLNTSQFRQTLESDAQADATAKAIFESRLQPNEAFRVIVEPYDRMCFYFKPNVSTDDGTLSSTDKGIRLRLDVRFR